jgi:uracil-DNA glycosylase
MNYASNCNKENIIKNEIGEEWVNILDISIIDQTEKALKQLTIKNKEKEFFPFDYNDVFKIFKVCKPKDVNVVILGQDPYFNNKSQANGIAFAVNEDVKIPPSLNNIFKELKNNYPDAILDRTLESWVNQGIFLLNASLTVESGISESHMNIWKEFTDNVIKSLSNYNKGTIFVLWGKFAEKKRDIINDKCVILSSSHPSPLSCYKTDKPFLGSKIFLKINELKADKLFF